MVTLNHPTQGNTTWFTPVDQNWTTIEQSLDNAICEGRLTLVTGTPVPATDVTGTSAQTIYFTAYIGNRIALYNGPTWVIYSYSSDISLSLSSISSGKNYDVFLYNNSGTLTLELSAAWTNDTTRADTLVLQDGIRVKSADHTRRFLGTIRAAANSQSEDSQANRFLINYMNRVRRPLFIHPKTTGSGRSSVTIGGSQNWTSIPTGTGTGDTNVAKFISNGEDAADYKVESTCLGAAGVAAGYIGVGEDSTTGPIVANSSIGTAIAAIACGRSVLLSEGYHSLTILVADDGNGVVTFYTEYDKLGAGTAPIATFLAATIMG